LGVLPDDVSDELHDSYKGVNDGGVDEDTPYQHELVVLE